MNKDFYINMDVAATGDGLEGLQLRCDFNVPNTEKSVKVKNEAILKHIVLVVTHAGGFKTTSPFQDVVIFQDDVEVDAASVNGKFILFLKDYLDPTLNGEVFAMCSLGSALSEVAKISLCGN